MFNKLKILTKMKIKNMKLMLLGFLAMGAGNVSAQTHTTSDKIIVDGYEYYWDSDALDEKGRSVNNIVYDLRTVTWKNYTSKTTTTKEATVIGVNSSASNADVATIAIPAEVVGDKGTYEVTFINVSTWTTAQKNVEAVTTSLSLDLTNLMPGSFSDVAYKNFTKLTSLTIKEASTTKTPNASKFDGSECKFKATLTTLDLTESRINEIADNGLKGFTALTGFDFKTITTVGKNAFDGCSGISELTIPATVTSIGADAFANMVKKDDKGKVVGGLSKLTFNAYSDKDKGFDPIPARFAGDENLQQVIITSTKAKSIEAGAFTGDNVIHWIDLSGMTALETAPTDAFDATLRLVSLKLAGTKLKEVAPSLAFSNRNLVEITFPAEITAATLPSFENFIALKAIDLSGTKVTEIPDGTFQMTDVREVYYGGRQAFEWNKDKTDVDKWTYTPSGDPVFIEPVLATVTLNPNTTKIGYNAFYGQSSLATITNLNQGKLESIGYAAFEGTGLATVDLSAATNAKFTSIEGYTFGEMKNLATVTLPAQITNIGAQAFVHDQALTSINLDATKLKVLNNLFTYDSNDDVDKAPAGITALVLPNTLTEITSFALQGLAGLEEIEIPSSVEYFGWYYVWQATDWDSDGNAIAWSQRHYYSHSDGGVLQGCLNLKKFTWKEAKQNRLPLYTFRGDTELEEVVFFTMNPIMPSTDNNYTNQDGLTDNHFFMCSDVLVYVSAESYEALVGRGYTPENSKYSILVGDQEKEFEFSEKGLASDGYYYKAIRTEHGCWFPADEFEVFVAAVEGDKVNLKAGEEFDGYYKVPSGKNIIIRSKNIKGTYAVKGFWNNTQKNNSIEKYDAYGMNHLRCYGYDGSETPGKLKYLYRLGSKNGVVAFYRITSGKFKKGQIYINAQDSKKDRLDIMIDGIDVDVDATAIFGIESANEDANAPIYNLKGMRVQKAQKGIYIQNGKKYIMK